MLRIPPPICRVETAVDAPARAKETLAVAETEVVIEYAGAGAAKAASQQRITSSCSASPYT